MKSYDESYYKSYGKIKDLGDLKEQLTLLNNEIRTVSSRIDELKNKKNNLIHGFGPSIDVSDRITELKTKTKLGKPASNTMLLLISTIIESLKNGPQSEKEIKESVTERCRLTGIKATNRGTVSGTNIEINAACNILSTLGLIEPLSELEKKKSIPVAQSIGALRILPIPYEEYVRKETECAEKILDALKARWGSPIANLTANASEAKTAASTTAADAKMTKDEKPSTEAASTSLSSAPSSASLPILDTSASIPVKQEPKSAPFPDPIGEMDNFDFDIPPPLSDEVESLPLLDLFGVGLMGEADPLNGDLLMENTSLSRDTSLPIDSSASIPVSTSSGSTSGAPPTEPLAVPQSKITKLTTKSKGGISAARIWQLKRSLVLTTDEFNLFYQPEQTLNNWSTANYHESAALEIEEKLLRKIAAQCGLADCFQPTNYLTGTRYLDSSMKDDVYTEAYNLASLAHSKLLAEDPSLSATALLNPTSSSVSAPAAGGVSSHSSLGTTFVSPYSLFADNAISKSSLATFLPSAANSAVTDENSLDNSVTADGRGSAKDAISKDSKSADGKDNKEKEEKSSKSSTGLSKKHSLSSCSLASLGISGAKKSEFFTEDFLIKSQEFSPSIYPPQGKSRDLFNSSINMDAAYLLNKVKKTKRMRGSVLPPGPGSSGSSAFPYSLYVSSYLDQVEKVVRKTQDSYWKTSSGSSSAPTKSDKKRKLDDRITVKSEHSDDKMSVDDSKPTELSKEERKAEKEREKEARPVVIDLEALLAINANNKKAKDALKGQDREKEEPKTARKVKDSNSYTLNDFLSAYFSSPYAHPASVSSSSSHLSSASASYSLLLSNLLHPNSVVYNSLLLANNNNSYSFLTANYLKRYLQPLDIVNSGQMQPLPVGASISAPLGLPDLNLLTTEIPWQSIAEEFQIVPFEDIQGKTDKKDHKSHKKTKSVEVYAPKVEKIQVLSRSLKKISSRDSNLGEDFGHISGGSESDPASSDEESEGEENLDEDFLLARHNQVLLNMREKWDRMAQLKQQMQAAAAPSSASLKRQDSTRNHRPDSTRNSHSRSFTLTPSAGASVTSLTSMTSTVSAPISVPPIVPESVPVSVVPSEAPSIAPSAPPSAPPFAAPSIPITPMASVAGLEPESVVPSNTGPISAAADISTQLDFNCESADKEEMETIPEEEEKPEPEIAREAEPEPDNPPTSQSSVSSRAVSPSPLLASSSASSQSDASEDQQDDESVQKKKHAKISEEPMTRRRSKAPIPTRSSPRLTTSSPAPASLSLDSSQDPQDEDASEKEEKDERVPNTRSSAALLASPSQTEGRTRASTPSQPVRMSPRLRNASTDDKESDRKRSHETRRSQKKIEEEEEEDDEDQDDDDDDERQKKRGRPRKSNASATSTPIKPATTRAKSKKD